MRHIKRKRKVDLKALKSLVLQGYSDKEIAKKLGISLLTVKDYRVKKLGIKHRQQKIDREKVKLLTLKGLKDKEIAETLKCNIQTVREIRRKLGFYKGERKVDEKMIQIIKDLNEAGFNDREIAGILGIDNTTVFKHRKRLGLPAVGHTCCSIARMTKIKDPLLKKRIEKCGEISLKFLDEYMRQLK